MTTDDQTNDPTERVVDAVMDACAVAVGLGVLAVNRVQSVRRQVQRSRHVETPGDSPADAGGERPSQG